MTEPSTTETKIEQIVKGIDGLSEEDYTSTGIPRVEALEAITGIAEITGDERDEAWIKHQAENPTKEPEPDKDKTAEDAEAAEAAEAGEGGATEDAEAEEASAEPEAMPEAVVGATEDRPTGSPQETTPEAAKVAEAPYVVAEGKAITSRKGILGPGEGVFPLYFGANGAAIIKKLEEDGMVVAT